MLCGAVASVSAPSATALWWVAFAVTPMATAPLPLAFVAFPIATLYWPMLPSSHSLPSVLPARKAARPGNHTIRVPAPLAASAPVFSVPAATNPLGFEKS